MSFTVNWQFKDECEPGFIIVVTSLIRKLRSVPFMFVLEGFDSIRFLKAPFFALFCLFLFLFFFSLSPLNHLTALLVAQGN